MKTKQETFDTVAKHLLTQNKKSISSSGLGLYKSGKYRCAAGCLIPDDEYSSEFENNTVEELISEGIVEGPDFFGHDAKLVHELQTLHDWYMTHEWKQVLVLVANDHNLKTDVLEL